MDMPSVPPPTKINRLDKFLLWISGVDEPTLRLCPQHDWEAVRAVAAIMICIWIYQTALFSLIAHKLFAMPGQFRLELIAASMFLATFILLIDSYMVMRSSWHLSGIAELKRGGIDISGGVGSRIKAGVFLAVRIFLSVCVAQLTAIFFGLLVFHSDVSTRIHGKYVHENANLIAAATAQADAEIHRAADALNAESTREAALASQVSALRQNQIDPSANQPEIQQAQQELTQLLSEKMKADEAVRHAEAFASNELAGIRGSDGNSGVPGEGPVRRAALEALANAKNEQQQITASLDAARSRFDALRKQSLSSGQAMNQQSHDALPRFESDLAAEDSKLQSLRDDVARLTQHRDEAIRDVVEAAPNHIPADNGLLAQLKILEHIAQADRKIAAVIILIDLTSFGFELAAVLAKMTSFVPTTYAALLARDAYMQAVRIVDGMMAELNRAPRAAEPEVELVPSPIPPNPAKREEDATAGSDPFADAGNPPSTPARRPRGRPPKSSFTDAGIVPLPYANDSAPLNPNGLPGE